MRREVEEDWGRWQPRNAFISALRLWLAGYGSIRLAQIILIEGSFKPLIDESSRGLEFIGLVVFFATLALMIKRVDAIQKERLERFRKSSNSALGTRSVWAE